MQVELGRDVLRGCLWTTESIQNGESASHVLAVVFKNNCLQILMRSVLMNSDLCVLTRKPLCPAHAECS